MKWLNGSISIGISIIHIQKIKLNARIQMNFVAGRLQIFNLFFFLFYSIKQNDQLLDEKSHIWVFGTHPKIFLEFFFGGFWTFWHGNVRSHALTHRVTHSLEIPMEDVGMKSARIHRFVNIYTMGLCFFKLKYAAVQSVGRTFNYYHHFYAVSGKPCDHWTLV